MPPHLKHKRLRKGRPKVFVVHGHDHGTKETVARFLEKLGCEPIILHEQPNKGATILQKFATHSDVDFAVVLLTGDDRGGTSSASFRQQRARARQNVILELGFFLGALGVNKVCSLYKNAVELPSDYLGVLYLHLEDAQWKTALAKELAASGIRVKSKILLTI